MRYDKDWDLECLESNIREFVDEQMAVGFLSPAEIVDSAIAIYQEDGDLCVAVELVKELTDEALRKHVYEQAFWPDTTDCERLDAAFAELDQAGIVARQNAECCGTCAGHVVWQEVEGRIAEGKPVLASPQNVISTRSSG